MIETHVDMSKDQIFKLRLDEADRQELEIVARHHQISAAQAVRYLVKQELRQIEGAATYRVSAWDGRTSTCLFWVGRDGDMAVEQAKELARQHSQAPSRWTVFRVYRGSEEEPIYRAAVGAGDTPRARVRARATNLATAYEDEDRKKR